MSFAGSTTQAENIVNGYPADIYASSLAPDVELVQKAGLITNDWQNAPDHSVVATSVVGFMVRPGNPKGIHNWSDLTQPGLQVLPPDPDGRGRQERRVALRRGHRERVRQVPPHARRSGDLPDRRIRAPDLGHGCQEGRRRLPADQGPVHHG